MNQQVKLHRTDRIAEYFVVVGSSDSLAPITSCDTPLEKVGDNNKDHYNNNEKSKLESLLVNKYEPTITDRYPIIDRIDSKLPLGIEYFCLPNGLMLTKRLLKPSFHSFVHTSENGSHMLGCCLTFYEELNESQYNSIRWNVRNKDEDINTNTTAGDDGNIQSQKETTTSKGKQEQCLYAPKCICIISSWPFVASFRKYLVKLYQISKSQQNKIPIERYICNIIDDVPAPPAAGKVDIIYYINDIELSFRCPAVNEPHVWREGSALPLFPIFECLSPENVCILLSLVLTERQVLFISSQYSLLISAGEAITSLMYPLTWPHAYIPILPYQLLGVLSAPFPFILGLHSSIYFKNKECVVSEETARVFLDGNKILFGSQGCPPSLPERRLRKLLTHIQEVAPLFYPNRLNGKKSMSPKSFQNVGEVVIKDINKLNGTLSDGINHISNEMKSSVNNNIESLKIKSNILIEGSIIKSSHSDPNINLKVSTKALDVLSDDKKAISLESSKSDSVKKIVSYWKSDRLPYYDDAMSDVSEVPHIFIPPLNVEPNISNNQREEYLLINQKGINERSLREGFLKFFVSILKNYKKYLIYGNPEVPDPLVKFRFQDFIADHPSDWQPFIRAMVTTQAFSQFIDERVLLYKENQDVIFFDESIDAKMNRYLYRKVFHQATDTPFLNDNNMHEHIKTYVPPSPDNSNLPIDKLFVYNTFPSLDPKLFSKPRQMKAQFNIIDRSLNQIRFKRKNSMNQSNNTLNSNTISSQNSSMASIYSCYLVILSKHILFSEYGSSNSQKSSSSDNHYNKQASLWNEINDSNVICLKKKESAKLALKTIFEVINCLSRCDHSIDEIVYRHIADACAVCGEPAYLIDLLVYMDDEGLEPDHHILHALAKAISVSNLANNEETSTLKEVNSSTVNSFDSQSLLQQKILKLYTQQTIETAKFSNTNNVLKISPTEVWTIRNWRPYQNTKCCSLLLRKSLHMKKSIKSSQGHISNKSDSWLESDLSLSNLLFRDIKETKGSSSPVSTSAVRSSSITSHSVSQHVSEVNRELCWSNINSNEGVVPDLKWVFESFDDSLEDFSDAYAASKKLHRLVRISEHYLQTYALSLSIDLGSPFGTICPGPKCSVRRPLTIGEIYQGWEEGVVMDQTLHQTGNVTSSKKSSDLSNTYTTKCIHCGFEFIPRFHVIYRSESTTVSDKSVDDKIDNNNSFDIEDKIKITISSSRKRSKGDIDEDINIEETSMWCELLNPWVLTKEIFNIMYDRDEDYEDDGFSSLKILSKSYMLPSSSSLSPAINTQKILHRAVIFWNMVLAFRLKGLPYAFLFTNNSIVDSFPPSVKKEASENS